MGKRKAPDDAPAGRSLHHYFSPSNASRSASTPAFPSRETFATRVLPNVVSASSASQPVVVATPDILASLPSDELENHCAGDDEVKDSGSCHQVEKDVATLPSSYVASQENENASGALELGDQYFAVRECGKSLSTPEADHDIPDTPSAQGAIEPFALRTRYWCPFRVSRRCMGSFRSYRGLCEHVRYSHQAHGLVCSYEKNPFPDGTHKIPCYRGCGALFVSHLKAAQHASNPKSCQSDFPPDMKFPCSWHEVTGVQCAMTFDSRAGASFHATKVHGGDPRGPYRCCRGCGRYYADLYILAYHEDSCKGGNRTTLDPVSDPLCNFMSASGPVLKASDARTVVIGDQVYEYRFPHLGDSATPASRITVGRSSNKAPEFWKSKTGSVDFGLPIWGGHILSHYEHFIQSQQPAVLYVAPNVATKDLPAAAQLTFSEDDNHKRQVAVRRAWKFSNSVEGAIVSAVATGVRPTVICAGLDAWFCNTSLILPFLQRIPHAFDIVIRIPGKLSYGLTDQNFTLNNDVFWGSYDSQKLTKTLETPKAERAEPKYEELIAAWDQLQAWKNGRTVGWLQFGRNSVNLKRTFSTDSTSEHPNSSC